ncbi:MAG: diguanylate cyclase [Syntrophomonadaceae bacterium]|nr:diguanylate cyclase [Syntrophomonadaceae bacterium]
MSAGDLRKEKQILLVEDSRLTVKILADFLHQNGYETQSTATGEDAIQIVKSGLPVDLIIMDIGLAGEIDGIEAARRILEFRDVPVVFMTANTSGETMKKIKEVNAYGFVLKGMDNVVMLSILEMALKLHATNVQVRLKEAMLSAIFDSARDGIVMLDGNGSVTFWNPAAERLFGYALKEVLGKELHRMVVPSEYAYNLYQKVFKHFQLTGKSNLLGKTTELEVKHKDGRKIDAEVSLSALKQENAWHVVGVVRDISTRKQAQEKLEKSHKEYLELAENAPIGILKCDLEGNITYVNEKVLEILGSPDIEETKKINLFTFPLLIEHGVSKILQESLKNKQPGTYEVNYETKWGRIVWLRIHIKLLVDKDKETGIQLIIDDITEKKQLEEKLRLLSVTDELTNIYNRRFMKEKLEEEKERAKRTGSTFSVIMLDIDHFKKINDCYGHNTGDLILKTIAQDFKNRIRKTDTLARWGGDEVMILVPETTVKNAACLAEELCLRLREIYIPDVGYVTASFGVAGYRSGDTIDALIKRADDMMYKAKNEGKNCVRYSNT